LLASLWTLLADHAYVMVFLVTAIDATGTPFPGRALLVASGVLAASGHVSVVAVILLAAAGAVVGDHAWYFVGRWRGQRLLALACRVTMRSGDCLERANTLLQRYGPLAIVLGRFLAALRVFVTAAAAGSGLPYYQYLFGEIVGALLWSSVFVLFGYGIGQSLSTALARADAGAIALVLLGGAVVLMGAAFAYRSWRRRRSARRTAPPSVERPNEPDQACALETPRG
jgi:membrane-associated protein